MGKRDILVRQQLLSIGFDGLYETLQKLKGIVLNDQYCLRELYSVGGQNIYWLVDDLSNPELNLLACMVFLPYHRPAYISNEEIIKTRHRSEREAKILNQLGGNCTPKFHELIYEHNPIHSIERDVGKEPFVIMEYIKGTTVDVWAKSLHLIGIQKQRDEALVLFALSIVETAANFFLELFNLGFLYADFNPRNLMKSASLNDCPIRILDVGSIIPSTFSPNISVPYTEAYIPPDFLSSYQKGIKKWPTFDYLAYTLGKTLWHVLTNQYPMIGEDPEFRDEFFDRYPEPLVDFVKNLIQSYYQNNYELRDGFENLMSILNG